MLASLAIDSLIVSLLLLLLGWVDDSLHASSHNSANCLNRR
jgi:hypothetical protein